MLIDNYSKKSDVIDYINTLEGYRGYVQFSHRSIVKEDVFEDRNPCVKDEQGFVFEAHFFNGKESIMIRQQNAYWVVLLTPILDIDSKDIEYFALEKTTHLEKIQSNWVKMVQIWTEERDPLCEDMEVLKLQKVVFAGFSVEEKKGESK